MRRAIIPALVLPLLSACSAISALSDASQPLDIYELRTPPVSVAASRRPVELVVEEPVATGALAVERIMIQPSLLQAQYLPGVRWSDTAPVMIQTLLLRGLSETEALTSVGRRPLGSVSDYSVLSDLTDFQAEIAENGEGVLIRTRLVMRIVRESDTQVIANRTFEVLSNASTTEVDDITASFDSAASELLSEAIEWILVHAR